MFSFRGDAHKIFMKVKKQKDIQSNQLLKETAEIKLFYRSLDSEVLRLTRYRMLKEQNGSGMIPIFVTAVPWLLFLFSNNLEKFLFRYSNWVWIGFVTVYLISLTISVVLHYKEKAWAALHVEIIKDVLNERE